MISKLCVSTVLLAASVAAAAADSRPRPGSYGFNWLDAGSKCRKLTDKDLAKASKCSISDNAFGLSIKSHLCKVSAHVELVVYETAAQCGEALATMQANGD